MTTPSAPAVSHPRAISYKFLDSISVTFVKLFEMKRLVFYLLAAAALCRLHAAEWNKATSANFELYTTAGERDARETLQLFEQVRAFFMEVKSSSVTTRLPVTIVGFRNAKEYKPYALNEVAAAYYTGDEQRDYIVMSNPGIESAPTAIHEYVHLLVRHSGLKMPIWLNEGFAEVYSTLKPVGGKILLGSIPQGRTYALAQEKWLPLPALFAVAHDSPEYNEKNRAGILYAQSWLLTHMLTLEPRYREKFPAFAAQLSGSGSTEEAFSRVYGMTLAQVQTELNAYYRSDRLTGELFNTKFEKFQSAPMQPATELETGLTLAKLVLLTGHTEEAASRLNSLAAGHKDSYEVEEALAHLEWRKGNLEGAHRHFEAAIQRGATSWKTYWDYARLPSDEKNGEETKISALRKAIELKSDLTEARLMLGSELYRINRYAQALIELRQVKKIDEERAPMVFLLMAYSAMQMKMEKDAEGYAEQALKYARQPSDTASAQRLLSYIRDKDAPRAPVAASVRAEAPAASADTSAGPPALQRRELDTLLPPSETPENLALTVKGKLKQLDCFDSAARMHVLEGTTSYLLLIRTPDRVAIRNNLGASVDMTCGAQDTAVSVEYTLVRDEKNGTIGDVRAIEFQQ